MGEAVVAGKEIGTVCATVGDAGGVHDLLHAAGQGVIPVDGEGAGDVLSCGEVGCGPGDGTWLGLTATIRRGVEGGVVRQDVRQGDLPGSLVADVRDDDRIGHHIARNGGGDLGALGDNQVRSGVQGCGHDEGVVIRPEVRTVGPIVGDAAGIGEEIHTAGHGVIHLDGKRMGDGLFAVQAKGGPGDDASGCDLCTSTGSGDE